MLKIGWKKCPYCGDHEVYRSGSGPLSWLDRNCGLFLLQLVRCRECELRHYRPIFLPAAEYPGRRVPQTSGEMHRDQERSA